MFQVTEIERQNLKRSQIVTASRGNANVRYLPFAFTELGIAMLSSVLKSDQAIQVNISIMRAFFRLRRLVKEHESLADKVVQIEENSDKLFKLVFERLDQLEDITPPPTRRKLGI
jgi:hypothetical protein